MALGEDDPDAIITDLLSDQLGLGDDLTPIDDTEDDEAAQGAELSGGRRPETHENRPNPPRRPRDRKERGVRRSENTQPAAETHADADPGAVMQLELRAPDAQAATPKATLTSHVDSAGHDGAGHHGDDSHGDDSQGDDDGGPRLR